MGEAGRLPAASGPGYAFDPPLPWEGNAVLEGRVGAEGTRGVGTITFVAGTNLGRVFRTAADGSFRAEGLFSGLQWVEVRRAGLPTSRRAVKLQVRPVARLECEPASGEAVLGLVLDSGGEPIVGAAGTFDGRPLVTDSGGTYRMPRETTGRPLVQLSAEGYELVMCEVRDEKPGFMPREDRFTLQPEALLEVVVHAERPLSRGNIRLEVVPQGRPNIVAGAQATYRPIFIESLSPDRLGSLLLFDSLPRGEVRVRASHPEGASPVRTVRVVPGQTSGVELTVELQPLVQGRVLRDGRPVPDAHVQIVVEMPLGVYANELGSPRDKPLPLPIEARRDTRSDRAGRYRLGAFEGVSARRILRVLDKGGQPVAARVLEPGVRELDIRVP